MALLTRGRRLPRLLFALVVAAAVSYLAYDVYFGATRTRWRPFAYIMQSSFDGAPPAEKRPSLGTSLVTLSPGELRGLRRIQHSFSGDWADKEHASVQARRRDVVRNAFKKSWESYREYAWGHDGLDPLRLTAVDGYGGWGATLIDALDTLWLMGMYREFREAVRAVATIDWNNSTAARCSLFETNVRHLGGLLAAYELSGEKLLLTKALELGTVLAAAFDTPNRMPANDLNFRRARAGSLVPSDWEASASVGTLSLEFTRLAQLTGHKEFYDAIDKIKWELWRTQDSTQLPGMWPSHIDLQHGFGVADNTFTLGAYADSLYEYLPKMYAMLGGLDHIYADMHRKAMGTAVQHLLYRPMLPHLEDILFSGRVTVKKNGDIQQTAESQHLACFAGGMFALGGRLFGIPEHVEIGDKLTRGCAWAYAALPTGIMPEVSEFVACDTPDLGPCEWNQTRWEAARPARDGRLPPGFAAIRDPHYRLRPDAIESVFTLYRITGNRDLQDIAWTMFQSVKKATETAFAYSAIANVNVKGPTDKTGSMESFWFASTLKYFYLIFSEPGYISLDDYVFNTEGHPLRIMKPR